eukprot:3938845-Rhodomonas_salina.1
MQAQHDHHLDAQQRDLHWTMMMHNKGTYTGRRVGERCFGRGFLHVCSGVGFGRLRESVLLIAMPADMLQHAEKVSWNARWEAYSAHSFLSLLPFPSALSSSESH